MLLLLQVNKLLIWQENKEKYIKSLCNTNVFSPFLIPSLNSYIYCGTSKRPDFTLGTNGLVYNNVENS